MFITVEGIDGAGKTTQAEAIAKWLKETSNPDKEIIVTAEPKHPLSEFPCIKGREDDEVMKLLVFLASRRMHYLDLISPALERGATVISDRFTDSTLAYQVTSIDYYHAWLRLIVKQMNKLMTDNLTPDLTILVDVPVKIATERICSRNPGEAVTLGDISYLKQVRQAYLDLAEEDRRIAVVDGSLNVQEVEEQIKQAIASRLFIG